MTNITEIIDQAAKKYCACGMDKGCVHKTAFTAGASFASTDPEMMKAMLQPFAEWCDNEYFTIQNPSMAVTKYIQFITDKQKEDAGR